MHRTTATIAAILICLFGSAASARDNLKKGTLTGEITSAAASAPGGVTLLLTVPADRNFVLTQFCFDISDFKLVGSVLGTGAIQNCQDYEPGLMPDALRRGYTAWLERFLIRRADLLTSVGYRLAALRLRQTGRNAEVIPNGVDWAPSRSTTASDRTYQYGLAPLVRTQR